MGWKKLKVLRPNIRHQQMGPVTSSRLVALEHCIQAKVGTMCLYPVSGSSSPIKHSHIQLYVAVPCRLFRRVFRSHSCLQSAGYSLLINIHKKFPSLFFVQDPVMHAFNFNAKEVAFAWNSCADWVGGAGNLRLTVCVQRLTSAPVRKNILPYITLYPNSIYEDRWRAARRVFGETTYRTLYWLKGTHSSVVCMLLLLRAVTGSCTEKREV